jgi:hypothetical protein
MSPKNFFTIKWRGARGLLPQVASIEYLSSNAERTDALLK